MKTSRLIAALIAILIVAGGAYTWQTMFAGGNYGTKNVAIGSIATTTADQACNGKLDHERLVCLADALKTTLSPKLSAEIQLPYTVADAKSWSNFPPAGYNNRVGPTLDKFTPDQLGFIKEMLKTAAGIAVNEGYDEMEQILNADDYLKAKTTDNAGFSSGNFHIAFLGAPAAQGTWELYFGGHHMAFANTYKDGKLIGATPSFRGVEPFTKFNQNNRENQPMAQEQGAFAAMLTALDSAQQTKAKLSQTFTDIIVGPQNDDAFPSLHEGVLVGDLDATKQALVIRAIETYVRDVDAKDADVIMQKYSTELGRTSVAFSGTVGMNTENDYVRIDGPSVWIEFSMQPGRSLPGIHPHSIWRDRASDYGGNK